MFCDTAVVRGCQSSENEFVTCAIGFHRSSVLVLVALYPPVSTFSGRHPHFSEMCLSLVDILLIVFRSRFTRRLPVPESLGTFGLLISKHEATEILPHPKALPLDIVGEGYTCSENYLYQKETCPRYIDLAS